MKKTTLVHKQTNALTRAMSESVLIEAISGAGSAAPNEDRFGTKGDHLVGAAWVIDGATSAADKPLLPGSASDPAWYAERLSRAFESNMHDLTTVDVKKLSTGAIRQVAEEYKEISANLDIPVYAIPCAAGLVVTWPADFRTINYGTLGDCSLLAGVPGKRITKVTPDRGDGTAEARFFQRVKQANPDTAHEDLLSKGKEALKAGFAKRNTNEGGWVFRTEAEAVNKMKTGQIKLEKGAYVLLVSDGFYRLVDVFGKYNDEELFKAAIEKGLKPLYEELRKLELDAAAQGNLPRLKVHDDATALLIRPKL